MSETKEVFYVGRKPEKTDNVNKDAGGRKWRGFGDSKVVPSDQADALFEHPDVWGDAKAFAEAKKQRKAEDKDADERADLVRRRDEAARKEMEKQAEAAARTAGTNETEGQDDGNDEVDRDALLKGAILSLDPDSDEDYTKPPNRKPRVNRIIDITGASFSAEELTIAFQELTAAGKIKV